MYTKDIIQLANGFIVAMTMQNKIGCIDNNISMEIYVYAKDIIQLANGFIVTIKIYIATNFILHKYYQNEQNCNKFNEKRNWFRIVRCDSICISIFTPTICIKTKISSQQ